VLPSRRLRLCRPRPQHRRTRGRWIEVILPDMSDPAWSIGIGYAATALVDTCW